MRTVLVATLSLFLLPLPSIAQQQAEDLGVKLLQDAAVKAALAAAKADEARTLAEQVELCEVEAPPFKEAKRGELYARKFRELGLQNVRIDKVGNVLGDRPGAAARPHFVLAAHLDTVFPEGTVVKTTLEGTTTRGPGIGDDCRGLAVQLAVIRALKAGNVQTPGSITFVGDVGEEGLGDLRGVKYLFDEGMKGQIDRFVSIDGTGLGITHISVGSLRYRITFKGPGGHSYGAFGLVNPIHALGRAMATIGDFQVPSEPKTTFSVGRIGGGTSVNSIPFEAWMEVDMRSADAASLQSLDAKFHKAVDDAVAAENARWGSRALSVSKDLVGNRPAGRAPVTSAIVQAAASVTRALGFPVSLDEGSTDANYPQSLGIAAITVDGGGRGTGAHALDEAFDSTDSWKGTQRALLLTIALAQP
ncbi:MAG: M20/M25/M40 family metallo-hydrolase [Acidobacteriota bacterium]